MTTKVEDRIKYAIGDQFVGLQVAQTENETLRAMLAERDAQIAALGDEIAALKAHREACGCN